MLAAGGALVIPPAIAARDPAVWRTLLADTAVTIWNSVPALMELLVTYVAGRNERLPAGLRLVMLSGDWVPVHLPDQVHALAEGAQVFSLGGATEAAIWSILYPVAAVDPAWTSIPYGTPMHNQQFYVLDERLEPRPEWVPGALYIGGAGLARGYLNEPGLTAERFAPNPFIENKEHRTKNKELTGRGAEEETAQSPISNFQSPISNRLYKTGDLGRYLPDGTIEFLGREDFQVKIGGYRIELGEIEAALGQHPNVRNAVVTAVGEPRGVRRLVAYVVPGQEQRTKNQEQRREAPDSQFSILNSQFPGELRDPTLRAPWARLAYKMEQPGMRRDVSPSGIVLAAPQRDAAALARMLQRRSVRTWEPQPIPFAQFSAFLGCLQQIAMADRLLPKYHYPSAGSLYPVQTYLYIKAGRVEGVPPGTYYYHPTEHRLAPLALGAQLDRAVHAAVNQALFDDSAFSLFLVGQMGAITPVYGERARDFCLLEAGAMVQELMTSAPASAIGVCPIGALDEARVREALALEPSHEVLHSLLGGGVSPLSVVSGQLQPTENKEQRTQNKEWGSLDNGQPGALWAADNGQLTRDLRQFLRDRLPGYMVPSAFVLLDALPLTPNGKVDRRALPVPAPPTTDVPAAPAEPSSSGMAEPVTATDLEQALVEIWEQVLGMKRVGVTDNFFELGGSSVHLIQVQQRLRAVLGREVAAVELFTHPTIRALVQHLGAAEGPPKAQQPAAREEIDERVQQQRKAIGRYRQRKNQQ